MAAIAEALPVVQRTPEWLEARGHGVGASEAAAALGLSRWESKYSLWARKCGLVPPPEPSVAMRVGTALEPMIASLYADQVGMPVRRVNRLLRSKAHPFLLASLDRRRADGRLEHKPSLDPARSLRPTTHIYTRAHLRAGGPPLYHVIDRGAAEAVRSRAKRKGAFSPWDSDWDEMAKKTCAKAHAKWLPVPADVLDLFAREDALAAGEPEPAPAAELSTRAPRTRQLAARIRGEETPDPAPQPQPQAAPATEPDVADTDSGAPAAAAHGPSAGPSLTDDEAEAVWRVVDGPDEAAAAPAAVTSEAFTAWLEERRIATEYARGVAGRLFPGTKRLTDEQRARLRDELAKAG